MDAMLKGLFGDQDDDTGKRDQAQDFINRYDEGLPHENISGEEALNNYQAVAGQLSPQELEDSATEAYERLSPDDRRQFAQWLQERGGDQVGDVTSDDPRQLARVTTQLQSQQPGGLAGLLGGGGLGGMLGGAGGGNLGGLASGLLGGGQGQRGQGGGMGDILQNPIARAALGGIAAMAMKKMLR
jgi:hypothetical protein